MGGRIQEMEDALADERQTTGVQAQQIQDLYRKLAERELHVSKLQCHQAHPRPNKPCPAPSCP